MAKLFPIGLEVEEVAVGSVLRLLNRTQGVAKIHLNLLNEPAANEETSRLEPDEVSKALPPPKKAKHGSMQLLIAETLSITPAHSKILQEVLRRNGFSPNSLPAAISTMRTAGFVKKVGVATWRLTGRGHRHYIGGEDKGHVQRHPTIPINNKSGVRSLVLTSLNNATQLLTRDLQKVLKENKYSPTTLNAVVTRMKREGLISSSHGTYSITDQGRSAIQGGNKQEVISPTEQ